jgi:hypothetical protein
MISMKKPRKIKMTTFTIHMNELNLNRRKFTTSEISRGTGVQKNKKGKGSYTRKSIKVNDNSYGCIIFSKSTLLI